MAAVVVAIQSLSWLGSVTTFVATKESKARMVRCNGHAAFNLHRYKTRMSTENTRLSIKQEGYVPLSLVKAGIQRGTCKSYHALCRRCGCGGMVVQYHDIVQ